MRFNTRSVMNLEQYDLILKCLRFFWSFCVLTHSKLFQFNIVGVKFQRREDDRTVETSHHSNQTPSKVKNTSLSLPLESSMLQVDLFQKEKGSESNGIEQSVSTPLTRYHHVTRGTSQRLASGKSRKAHKEKWGRRLVPVSGPCLWLHR